MFSVVKCHGTGQRMTRILSVAWRVSSRRRISGRAMELVKRSRVFLGAQRSKFARVSYLVSGEPWSTVRMEQRAFGAIPCPVHSDWSMRWHDVCICTGAQQKGCRFVRVSRAGLERWSSLGAEKVQEKVQVHPCQVTCAPVHRARCRFRKFRFGRE